MITTTEFFLFVVWGITLGYAMYEKGESHKAKKLVFLLLSNDEAREKIVSDYKFFSKSIIKNV